MSDNIQLTIISSDNLSITTEISELYIPAYYGEAGILENHLPFIAMLGAGEVSYREKNGEKRYLFVNGGFLENRDNKIFLISDDLEKAENLDLDQINLELEQVDASIQSALKGEISPEELTQKIQEQKALKSKISIIEKISN